MIVTLPNKILREKSKPVPPEMFLSSEIKNLISAMREEIKISNGVGLAAVQIGELWRVILVENDGHYNAFVNPEIIKKSWSKIALEEGCLSVPGKFGYVRRHKSVIVHAVDETGKEVEVKAQGLPAVVFQHEIDHLNGVLFIDKLVK
jgi:peptide deformylase